MKQILACAFLTAAAAVMSGCASTTGVVAVQTPAQVAAQVCPPTETAIASLKLLQGMPAQAIANLATAEQIVTTVCTAGATVNVADLQTLATTALPIVLDVVQASPLDPAQQNQIILGVSAAQIVISAVLAAQPVAAAPVAPTAAASK